MEESRFFVFAERFWTGGYILLVCDSVLPQKTNSVQHRGVCYSITEERLNGKSYESSAVPRQALRVELSW